MTRASSVARLWTTTTEAEKTEGDGSVPVGFVPQPSATILELNLRNYGVGLVVGPTSIRYIGNGSHSTDVGAIQTSRPVPSCASVYYYEITILEKGERGYVSLGFADRAFKLNRQCGWENNSYGYHGDDGKQYSGSGLGTHYAPTFTNGDVVGAGLHTETNDIFFTKNGKWLGVAFRDVCITPLYPTVGLHSKDERVSTNFGSAPFAFDIETYISEENYKRTLAVAAEDLSTSVAHELIRDYLNFHGYAKTLRALDDAAAARGGCDKQRVETSAAIVPDDDDDDVMNDVMNTGNVYSAEGDVVSAESFDLCQRAHIHSLILAGNVDTAEEHLRDKYPGVFLSDYVAEVRLHLACQRYVEIIRAGQFSNALKYAQSAMPTCVGLDPSWDEAIRGVTALVAYHQPGKSPLSLFLTPAHRDRVADAVNAAVLAAAHVWEHASQAPLTSLPRDNEGADEEEGRLGKVEVGRVSASSAQVRRGEFDIPAIGVPTMAAVLGLGSRAEVLLRQLFISAQELRAVNGGKGEVFELVCSRR